MEELFERFPEMTPIDQPPSLSTINGFGPMLYGDRDRDPETETYVKTLWFAALCIPILPLGAYRVADAPGGGWYFLGKVPVSPRAKIWPVFFVLLVGGLISLFVWSSYTRSPEYLAKQKLDEAAQLAREGKVGEAGHVYREVVEGNTKHAPTAMQEIVKLLESQDLSDKEGVGELFRAAWQVHDHEGGVRDIVRRGLTFAGAAAEKRPQECLAVLEAVEPALFEMPPDDAVKARASSLAVQQTILEKLLKDKPDDLDLSVKLAVIYERSGQRGQCEGLLGKHAKKLGTTEGARVLGQIYAQQGKYEEAYALLQPYTEERLKRLQEAEKTSRAAFEEFFARLKAELESGKAPDFDFKRYQTLPPQKQNEMIQEYRLRRLNAETHLRDKQEAIQREAGVISVALDLAIVRMRRAQVMPDKEAGKVEMQKAEKTLLSLQEAAAVTGTEGNLKLRLGEVYFWMGRQKEGKAAFEEVLKNAGRNYEALMQVAGTLRDLGEWSETRKLTEEAYNAGGTEEKRQSAASLRGLTPKDIDDKIAWLEKANRDVPLVQASLAQAKAEKAEEVGDDDEAAKQYREVIRIYKAQTQSAGTLNNGALGQLALYRVTGDPDALAEGVRMMEKAAELEPRNAILAANVSGTGLANNLREVLAAHIDLKKLKMSGAFWAFSYLHQDRKTEESLRGRLQENPGIARARARYDRALILRPNSTTLIGEMLDLYAFFEDRPALEALARRTDEAVFDLEQQKQDALDNYAGKKDDKRLKSTLAAVARAERLVNDTRDAGGPTFAVAVGSYVSAHTILEQLDKPFDPDALVKLAEEAHKAAPSKGSIATLETALLIRAHRTLRSSVPDYAAMTKRCRRALGPGELIAVALWREGKPREAAQANEDVKRVLEFLREDNKKYPDSQDEWSWAMLAASFPEEAKGMADALAKDDKEKVERQLRERISSLSASRALRSCWALDMTGKHKEALDVLNRAAASGVPMPFDVP